MKDNKRMLTERELKCFNYLNDLRESGICNMFEGPAYMTKNLDIPRPEAIEIWKLWTQNFRNDGNYDSIKVID